MKVLVKYSAVLNLENVDNGGHIEISQGTTIAELLSRCNVREEQQKYILIFVNEEKKGLDYILQDKDQLNLYLPIGGG
jgi:molybdopterin converting factor small subunit